MTNLSIAKHESGVTTRYLFAKGRRKKAPYEAGVNSIGAETSIRSVSTIGGIAAKMSKIAPNKTNDKEAIAIHLGLEIRLEAPIAPAVLPIAMPIVR